MVVHPGLQKLGLQFWILDPHITPLQIFDSIIEFFKSGRMGNSSEAAKYFVLEAAYAICRLHYPSLPGLLSMEVA